MLSVRKLATLGLAVATVFSAAIARGDGPCNAGFRDSTPAERARMTAILEIAKKSLPPAPAGWQIGGYEEITVVRSVCRDGENRPWNYGISRTYDRVDDYEARQKIMRDAAAYAAAEQAKRQPQIDALTAQMQQLSARQVALVQKGDMAGAQKINYDLEKIQNEYKKVLEGGDSQARIAAAGKEMERDLHMSISVRVNETAVQLGNGAANFPPPPGASVAQRWTRPATADMNEEGRALVLYGKWNRAGTATQWTAAPRANAVPTAAHVISVEVKGDPARIDALLQGIDFKSLATALTK
jgi:hypothetical protein